MRWDVDNEDMDVERLAEGDTARIGNDDAAVCDLVKNGPTDDRAGASAADGAGAGAALGTLRLSRKLSWPAKGAEDLLTCGMECNVGDCARGDCVDVGDV
mmetsp:Transcript_44520/g.105508  ORF Transcript_44520/g.105508 Transcript_44520/m.105508 type:complete len:100 (-) Transcript_44520:368-667(-)